MRSGQIINHSPIEGNIADIRRRDHQKRPVIRRCSGRRADDDTPCPVYEQHMGHLTRMHFYQHEVLHVPYRWVASILKDMPSEIDRLDMAHA